MVAKVMIFFLSLLTAVVKPMASQASAPGNGIEPSRQKRTLVYTADSATGILIALSVPLLITGRNIFMAYNFEANYGMTSSASDFTQGVLKKVDNDQIHPPEDGEPERRAVRMVTDRPIACFTRKKLYRTIELNLTRYGYDGKKCILRMICELAGWPVGDSNGVVGDLLQLVFTPSSSHYEKLPNEFYLAQELGMRQNCFKYTKHCPKDPLDVISLIV